MSLRNTLLGELRLENRKGTYGIHQCLLMKQPMLLESRVSQKARGKWPLVRSWIFSPLPSLSLSFPSALSHGSYAPNILRRSFLFLHAI